MCIDWYETRYVVDNDIRYRVVYQHCLRLLGRQQGALIFTITLLPGEKVKLYHYERYRRTRAASEIYSVHTSFRQAVSAIHQSRATQSTSSYEEFLNDERANGDVSVTVGGMLFPVSWDAHDVDTNLHFFQSASAQSASEDFSQTARTASQSVETERSISVSTFEDKETQDQSVREFQNSNDCRAVTYFVRRVNEVYQLITTVWSVSWMTPGSITNKLPTGQNPWRSMSDHYEVDPKLREVLARGAKLLPQPGQIVQDPMQITLATDGLLYEPELAHCSSCEPSREAEVMIRLEKEKADADKACFEAQLVGEEVSRRQALLDSGNLAPFDPPTPTPGP
jgi:thermitase